MKKHLSLIILCAVTVACTVTSKTKTVDTAGVVKSGIMTEPILAEIDIKNERVKGSYMLKTTEYSQNKQYGKNMAVASAISSAKADFLVEPMYEITTTGMNTEIKVEGFPAFYRNFRAMTAADTTIIDMGYAVPVKMKSGVSEVEDDAAIDQANKKSRLITGGIIAGGVLLLLLLL